MLLTGILILGVSFLSEDFVKPIVPAKDSFVVAGVADLHGHGLALPGSQRAVAAGGSMMKPTLKMPARWQASTTRPTAS